MGDPFGTAALRAAVLDAWAASPTRFREDANAEEDLRLGGYADAWLVELAQNAADAASAAGVPGRVALALTGTELRVANTGAPLDAAGVTALASLRASAKRDDPGAVGLFGVGFAAVLPLSDAPRIVSDGAGVAFSATRTARAVAGLPGPAAELARRSEPPVLRLAWDIEEVGDAAPVPDGYDTEVRLPLRPGVDGAALLDRAAAAAGDLLLALPDLVEIAVAGRPPVRRADGPGPGEVTIAGTRWLLARRAGVLGEQDVRGQATEQRGRRSWSVCWALPLTAGGEPAPLADDVLHAPTPTTERLGLPARLIATVPVEPDRRRIRTGPAAAAVLAGAVAGYLDLVDAVAPQARVVLVPDVGFPRSELDGRLREQLVDVLRSARWLPGAGGGLLAPSAAEWLDLPGAADRLRAQLAEAGFDRLVAADPAPPAALAVTRVSAAELVARLFGVERPPGWWRTLYAELAPLAEAVPGLVDELRALPVPLADDRTAAGPATVLLPGPGNDNTGDPAVAATAALGLPGLYVAHADAVHPLLARLGARAADPVTVLEHPALAEAVGRSVDDADAGLDPAPLASAVLALVAAVGTAPAGIAALALPDESGIAARADELVLPDAALRPLLAADAGLEVLDPAWAARFDRAVLTAVGVVDGFAVLVDEEPIGPDHDLHDEEDWWDGQDPPPTRLVAVRDLDLVDDGAWPAALALLAGERETREALLAPGSYTAWWLSRHALLDGHRPAHWRLPSATDLAALYEPVPAVLDEAVLAAVGVRADLRIRDTDAADDLLLRLVDPARRPDIALVARAHAALSEAVAVGDVAADDLALPEQVRAMDGSVVDVDLAVVLDDTWRGAVLPPGEVVVGGDPVALADLLDLPLASEVVAGDVVAADGERVRWSALAEVVLTCDVLGVPVPDGELVRHRELVVQLTRPEQGTFPVPAWRDDVGTWHAADPVRALLGLLAGGTDDE